MNATNNNRLEQLNVALAQVDELFQSNTQLYLWVMKYSITHGLLELVVHQGDYAHGHTIICGGCHYLSGPLQGGPYTLKLRHGLQNHEDLPDIVIIGNEDELVIKCSRISKPVPRKIVDEDMDMDIPANTFAPLTHLQRQVEHIVGSA